MLSDWCVLVGSLSDPRKQTGNHIGTEFRKGVGREMLHWVIQAGPQLGDMHEMHLGKSRTRIYCTPFVS